jgi:choline kinase
MTTRAAVILAAGVGSRLRPLTDDKPKALVEVSGRHILGRAMDALTAAGVERLVIASGYREDALVEALRGAPFDVRFRHNARFESTQNSVSLALCRDALEGEAFFRLDGDLVFDPAILSRLESARAPLVAAVDGRRALDAEAMKVRVDPASGRIAAFGKGIAVAEAAGESIGIEHVSRELGPRLFDALDDAIRRGDTHLYYEDVYSRMIESGLHAVGVEVGDLRWCEIDCIEDLASAALLFRT